MSNQDSIKCTAPEVGANLLSYGLGSLSDADAAAFEEHLLQCPACQAELTGSSQALKALSSKRSELVQKWKATSEDFESRHAATKKSMADDEVFQPKRSGRSFIWLGLAAACMIAFVFWFAPKQPHEASIYFIPVDSSTSILTKSDSIPIQSEHDSSHRGQDIASTRKVRSLATRLPLAFVFVNSRGETTSLPVGFEEAMRKYVAKDFHSAAIELEKVSKIAPQDSQVQLYLGISRYLADSHSDAITAFNNAELLGPRTTRLAQIRWFRANCWLALSEPEKAVLDLKLVAGEKTDYAVEAQQLINRLSK
jgi:hypothetical protein